jgi:hypothetical protein
VSRFTVAERDRVRDRILALAEEDERVVAGAVVGSLAVGPGDEWSDLDLTFAVAGATVGDVLEDWTPRMAELGGVVLFDLHAGATVYRVFLLPGCLQVDLSFTPASQFAPAGPNWRLLFGTAGEPAHIAPRPVEEIVGYGALFAVHARGSIARGRVWQAEHWITGVRNEALSLAARRHGVRDREYRGVDELPPEVLERAVSARAGALEPEELRRALRAAVELLLAEAGDDAAHVEERVRELVA